MLMALKIILTFLALLAYVLCPGKGKIEPGAWQIEEYLPLLEGKKVALLSNQTGIMENGTHLVDTLLKCGVDIHFLMSPEHGFRGTADAGEHVDDSRDAETGIPVISLYGGDSQVDSVLDSTDVLLFDIQDVGVRYYTYPTTMFEMMKLCAEHGKEMIILDRPNPLGFTVDGPVIDMKFRSAVGWLPVPVIHGMTMGELALMINGEGWLGDGVRCNLHIVRCRNYSHSDLYELPVRPSPNLPNMRSVYLYPSICLFEGTVASLGRGTDHPFQMYGHPDMEVKDFTFVPESLPGAKHPPLLGVRCSGVDLTKEPPVRKILRKGLDLSYVIDAYRKTHIDGNFFTPFFENLIGQEYVREMIEEGKSAREISRMWKDDVREFREFRKQYLIYPE